MSVIFASCAIVTLETMPAHLASSHSQSAADPNILEGGGWKTIYQPVLIYRKCTQRSIGLLHGKRQLWEKLSRGQPPPPLPPFESATIHSQTAWGWVEGPEVFCYATVLNEDDDDDAVDDADVSRCVH